MSVVQWTIKLTMLMACFASGEKESYGDNFRIECVPNASTFTTSRNAFSQIYEILNLEEDSHYKNSATTLCSVQRNFVLTEWIINGEPPSSLFIETGTNIISQLHDLTIICSASDIIEGNRQQTIKAGFYRNVTSAFTYQCQDRFHIILTDLRMLERASSKQVKAVRRPNDKCVTYGNKSKGTTPEWRKSDCGIGACGIGDTYRLMFNESGDFGCFQCCENHYWSCEHKECEACGPCSQRKERNVWTNCIPIDECDIVRSTTQSIQATSKSTTSSIITMSTKTSTTAYTASRTHHTQSMPITTAAGADQHFSTSEKQEDQTTPSSSPNHGICIGVGIGVSVLILIILAVVLIIRSLMKRQSNRRSGASPGQNRRSGASRAQLLQSIDDPNL